MIEYPISYEWTEHRKILTPRESGIESLPCFGLSSRQQASRPLENHTHPGCMEIVIMVRGFQIYEAGGDTFSLSGSDVFVTQPDEEHSSGAQPEGVSEIIWLQVDLTPGKKLFSLDESRSRLLREALWALPRVFTGNDAVKRQLRDAFFLLAGEDEFDRFRGEQLIVCSLQQLAALSRRAVARRQDMIAGAVQFIQDHIQESISLEDAAHACSLSLSRFKILFKEETGETPRGYINQLKIRRAQRLIREGMSSTEAAMAMGFSTPNYFSVVFRKFTGLTPTEYRERVKGER